MRFCWHLSFLNWRLYCCNGHASHVAFAWSKRKAAERFASAARQEWDGHWNGFDQSISVEFCRYPLYMPIHTHIYIYIPKHQKKKTYHYYIVFYTTLSIYIYIYMYMYIGKILKIFSYVYYIYNIYHIYIYMWYIYIWYIYIYMCVCVL